MKPATAASEVFAIKEVNNTQNTTIDYSITPDLLISRELVQVVLAPCLLTEHVVIIDLDSTTTERQLSDHALIDLTRTNKLGFG